MIMTNDQLTVKNDFMADTRVSAIHLAAKLANPEDVLSDFEAWVELHIGNSLFTEDTAKIRQNCLEMISEEIQSAIINHMI